MKIQIFIIIFLAITFICFAENGIITLSNTEDYWFYFCIDPEGVRKTPDTSSEFNAKVIEFFNEKIIPFISIPPGTTQNIKGLSQGSHLLLGFWNIPGAEAYPVWSTSFMLNAGEYKTFELMQRANQQTVASGTILIQEEKKEQEEPRIGSDFIAIDNIYNDWNMLPRLAAFSKNFNPVTFLRQTTKGIQILPIEKSSFWGRGGTRIIEVKALLTDKHLYFYFSSNTRLATGLSIVLYLFEERIAAQKNYYTIELLIDDTSPTGKVVLWQRGKQGYEDIGLLKNSSFYIETRISLNKLPKILLSNLVNKYSFDLVTSYFDKAQGIYEEFFFTTIYLRDIVTAQDLNE